MFGNLALPAVFLACSTVCAQEGARLDLGRLQTGATVCRYFSPLGKLCLVAMLISVVFQGWVLIGNVPALIGTGYGWVALGKLALLGLLFGLAVLNRYHLAPALRAAVSANRPIVPAPWMATVLPLKSPASLTACTGVANGSMRAAWWSLKCAGTL